MHASATAGTDTVTVNASGTLANGVGAHFDVIANGVLIGSGTAGVTQQAFSFSTTLDPTQANDIKVVYTNDAVINGQDRNLWLQSIVVDGKTISATSSLETYTRYDGKVLPGSGHMAWNGTADFAIPAAYLSPPPAVYYVAVNGNDTSGNGSAANPFATLGRAQAAMEHSSIHTTYMEGGVYNITQSLNLTSADNGFSFMSAPGQHAVLNGANAGMINLVWLSGASNITLQGLTFENTKPGYYNGAVTLTNSASNHIVGNLFTNNDVGVKLNSSGSNVISGNEIDNSVTAGINAGISSNNNTIDSNVINGVSYANVNIGSAGILFTGANNNAVTHNQIENTAGPGIAVLNWLTTDPTNLNIGNTIAYNSIVNANDSPLSTDAGAIHIDGRAGADTQTSIHDNYIHLSSSPTTGLDVGIYLDDFTSNATVTNNIVVGGNFGFLLHGGENNTLSNNIFDLGTRTASNIGVGLIQGEPGGPIATMTGNSVTRNIVYSTATAPSNAYVNYSNGSAAISNNLYYNTNGQPIDLAGQDTSPQIGNPQFVNAAAGNYALGAGSAASAIAFQGINQGAMALAPTTAHWY